MTNCNVGQACKKHYFPTAKAEDDTCDASNQGTESLLTSSKFAQLGGLGVWIRHFLLIKRAMAKRTRFQDRHKPTEKPNLSRKAGEHWKSRHRRRQRVAIREQNELSEFCISNGLKLSIKNNKLHWIIRHPKDPPEIHLAQWWPNTAKLIIRNVWPHGVHCHDVKQLVSELQRLLDGNERKVHRKRKTK